MSKLNAFQIRLNKIIVAGKLTRADVAKWTGKRYATVNNWFVKGSEPSGPYASEIMASLAGLEQAIKKKRGFPVPPTISYLERPAYIEGIRDGKRRRLSRSRPAARRVAHGRSDGAKRRKPVKAKPTKSVKPAKSVEQAKQAENTPAESLA